jgi:hypothetical protein
VFPETVRTLVHSTLFSHLAESLSAVVCGEEGISTISREGIRHLLGNLESVLSVVEAHRLHAMREYFLPMHQLLRFVQRVGDTSR